MQRAWTVLSWVLVVLAIAVSGCKKTPPPADVVLPVVREDTTDLELTYVDDKGNYHRAEAVKDVPDSAKSLVRVTDLSHDPPEDSVFVADLTQKKADGSFSVRVITRGEFDEVALNRRKAIGPTLAVNGESIPLSGKDGGAAVAMQPRVIIYGASWCSACHDAAAYLTRKKVPFVDKDIEQDSGAEREMNAKLAKAGLRGGGIPVIDVGGKIMVGFNPQKMDAALGESI